MIAAPWSDPAFQRVAALLGDRTGLAFSPARVADAEAGIRRAMARAGTAEVTAYLQSLEGGRVRLDDLIAELTVGETYFFREPLQWQVLREEVLPGLVRLRPPDHVLRVWSAGCASGEEAYSLAILMDELGLGDRCQILATDLSGPALERAAGAQYGPWSLRGVEPTRLPRHFSSEGSRWRLREHLRQRVRFERLNLASDSYPSFRTGTWRMDLILCRNVLIYLDDATVRRVARHLGDCLAPGGWLLTGASDPSVNEDGKLEAITTPAGILHRRPAPSPSPSPVPPAPPSPPSGHGSGAAAPSPLASSPTDALSEARAAFARGEYGLARGLTSALPDAAAAVLGVRAAANQHDAAAAARLAASSIAHHPSCLELHLLHAVLLIELGSHAEAAQASRRALYLDRSLAMGHYLLGTALALAGEAPAASKAFRNARDQCARLPPDQPVPFGDGQRAARLAEAAEVQLQLLARGMS
jgi:chemotaxis protein methyltransferase CheR